MARIKMVKRKKLKLSESERRRRRLQAIKNFKKIKTRGYKTMTKRRKTIKSKSNISSMLSGIASPLGDVAYGALRERLSMAISQTSIAQKIPQTEITDEALMLGVNWLAKKVGGNKIPIVKNMLTAQKHIELARIGEVVAKGQIFASGQQQATTSNASW